MIIAIYLVDINIFIIIIYLLVFKQKKLAKKIFTDFIKNII